MKDAINIPKKLFDMPKIIVLLLIINLYLVIITRVNPFKHNKQ